MRASPDCDRACLYRVLDQYLAGRKARDIRKVPWAAHVKNTENNVELRLGDGLWGTITALDAYEMRFADPQTPYPSLVHPMWSTHYGTYDHLARVKEWSLTGGAAAESH